MSNKILCEPTRRHGVFIPPTKTNLDALFKPTIRDTEATHTRGNMCSNTKKLIVENGDRGDACGIELE